MNYLDQIIATMGVEMMVILMLLVVSVVGMYVYLVQEHHQFERRINQAIRKHWKDLGEHHDEIQPK